MNKDELMASLKKVKASLINLRKVVDAIDKENISKPYVKGIAKAVSGIWFDTIKPTLSSFGVGNDTVAMYDKHFTRLIRATIDPATKKTTYVKTVAAILGQFDDTILIPVLKSAKTVADASHLEKIMENITNDDELRYIKQAIGCAENGFLGASVVLAWCGAIDRIQRKVEQIGFIKFNSMSAEMTDKKKGHLKFNKKFSVTTLNELRYDVPEGDLLRVVEGLELIDKAQRERLDDCYTKRCNAAHPGNAPITRENLESVFSDLKVIVFDNPKFALHETAMTR